MAVTDGATERAEDTIADAIGGTETLTLDIEAIDGREVTRLGGGAIVGTEVRPPGVTGDGMVRKLLGMGSMIGVGVAMTGMGVAIIGVAMREGRPGVTPGLVTGTLTARVGGFGAMTGP